MDQLADRIQKCGRLWGGIALLLMVWGAPVIGFWWLRSASKHMADSVAVWHTRDMLVHFHTASGGQWPQSWEDLEESFEPADASYGTRDLAALRQRIEVDFSQDPAKFTEADRVGSQPPRFLWVKGGRAAEEVDRANCRLANYFAERAAARARREAAVE